MENGIIWNVICDTYRREIERYGSSSMELSEKIFWIDSCSILALINALTDSRNAEQDRWRLSLRLIDDTLSAAQYSLEDKKELLKNMSVDYKTEFSFTISAFTKQLNDKFREQRKIIEQSFDDESFYVDSYTRILGKRKNDILPYIKQVLPLLDQGEISRESYMRSIIHMSMNRLFRSKNRLYEMVIYDFLSRYYQSLLAKTNYSTPIKIAL